MRRLVVIAALAVPVVVVACASITGADDLRVLADDGGASSSSGGPDGEAVSSGGEGGAGEGGIDPPLPECDAGVCVPTADGWTPATMPSFLAMGSCPDGWPTKTVYKTAGDFRCDCTCTPNQGSCEGPLMLVASNNLGCPGTPEPMPSFPGDGGCVAADLGVTTGSWMKVTVAPESPPTQCTGAPKAITGNPNELPVCSGAAAAPSLQCKPTESCVAKPGPGVGMCIVHDGLVACPAGFGSRVEITAGAVDDGRTCSASCTCDPSCNNGRIEAFFSANCIGAVGTLSPLGECGISPIPQGKGFRYHASNGCRVAQPPTVEGTVTLEAPKTLCCARQGGFGD